MNGLVEQNLKNNEQTGVSCVLEENNLSLFTRTEAPNMAKQQKRTKNTDKRQYKVINWPEYNQALVNRGNFTLWISEDAMKQSRSNGDTKTRT